MKILLVQPSNAVAGAELSALQILEGLSQRYGVTYHVALPPPDNSLYVSMLQKTSDGMINLPLMTWHRSTVDSLQTQAVSLLYRLYKGQLLSSLFRLLRYVRDCQIDIIYSNSGLCPVGAMAARLAGIPHVWHLREKMGAGSEFPLYLGDRLSKQLFREWSARVVCNSQFTAGFFADNPSKVTIILNGIETQHFATPEALSQGKTLRQSLQVPENTCLIGMTGSIFSSWKEHRLFLQAAQILKQKGIQAKYVIFGGATEPGHSVYAKSVFQDVEDFGLQADVLFAEMQVNIPAMMHSLDLMMHPTSQESSCRVVMEAMAAGKPVVGVNAGGVGELIRDGENGLSVPARNPERLAGAALQMLSEPALRQRLAAQAAAHARQYFDIARTQNEVHTVFQEVMSPTQ